MAPSRSRDVASGGSAAILVCVALAAGSLVGSTASPALSPSQEPTPPPAGAATQPPAPAPLPSQPSSRVPILNEDLQVTSVDLWVAAPRDRVGAWLFGDGATQRLDPASFNLVVDGRALEISAIAPRAAVAERPRVVIWFDAAANDQTSFRWAASLLSRHAAQLEALGDVEVIVADPAPRVVLAAGADAAALADLLASLALFEGTDAAVPLLRDQFLEAVHAAASEEEPLDELATAGALDAADALDEAGGLDVGAQSGAASRAAIAAAFVEEETAIVLHQQDRLLRHLTEGAAPNRGGRILLYVSQGFDRRPEEFYFDDAAPGGRGRPGGDGPPAGDGAPGSDLTVESETWVRTLAAYGWTCLPIVYEDRRALLRRGFRIGKWRFRAPRFPKPGDLTGTGFEFFGASYEGERDAGRAQAFVELGDGALARGEHAAAADAYLRAIHHFYGDPRTQERQAYAWQQLALALRGSGEADRARWAMANARALDPTLPEPVGDAAPIELAELTRDVSGLSELARETAGRVVRDAAGLLAAFEEIESRQRFTFALPGASTGELLPVALAARSRDVTLLHARFTRSGTPARVASARLRLALLELAAEPGAGEGSEREGRVERGAGDDGATAVRGSDRIVLGLDDLDPTRPARVVLGVLGEGTSPRLTALERAPAGGGGALLWSGELELAEETLATAVYIEDLASGEWGVEAVTLEEGG